METFMSEREEWFVGLRRFWKRSMQKPAHYSRQQRSFQEMFLLRTSALALFHGGDFGSAAGEETPFPGSTGI